MWEVVSWFPLALVSTLHQAHDAEEKANRPWNPFLRFFLSGWNERFRVMLQFLVTVRTRVRVKEIAQLDTTVRTFRSVHFLFLLSFTN